MKLDLKSCLPLFPALAAACGGDFESASDVEPSVDISSSALVVSCNSDLNCPPNYCMCSNHVCVQSPFFAGPPPPPNVCEVPATPRVPDNFETDDTLAAASHYLGSTQAGRNFHAYGNEDWILVYFATAGTHTFETLNLTYQANTQLDVYRINAATGQIQFYAGGNDDVCGNTLNPQCKASRVVLSVPANSVYAARVRELSPVSDYNDYVPANGYDFRIF